MVYWHPVERKTLAPLGFASRGSQVFIIVLFSCLTQMIPEAPTEL